MIAHVSTGTEAQKEQAAEELAIMALSADQRVAIEQEGGLAPLRALSTSGTEAQRKHAAQALENLSMNAESRAAIKGSGVAVQSEATPPTLSPPSAAGNSQETHAHVSTTSIVLEPHTKARGQDNPSYPKRQPVADDLVPWGARFPGYAPSSWTDATVLANDRGLETGDKWADPPDVTRAGLGRRFSYAGDGEPKSLRLDGEGVPLNPVGRTGLSGRGLLGKWGPNHAADPIVTRNDPEKDQLQMVAIQRKDTGQWALPGGMVDDGEEVSAKLRREFEEEVGKIKDPKGRAEFNKQARQLRPHRAPSSAPPSRVRAL